MPALDWNRLRAALSRPRIRILLGVALLLLAVRVALPYALRPILVSQADSALVGRIALADLDLSLIRGGVTLHGLEVHASELPPPGATASAPAPPLFDAQRLWVQIGWLALLTKTLRVEELELEGFHVRLERTETGFTLPARVPSDAPPEPAPEPTPGSGGWSLAADGVRLREGAIAFVDHTTGAPPSRVDLGVNDLSAENLELAIGSASPTPGRLLLRAQIGEGSIALDSRVESRPAGPALASTITLENLPLAGVRAYLKALGWSDLRARLDAELVHRFESGGAHELSGRLALSDVDVRVPELERPALAWQKLEVELEKIDLVAQQAGVAQVVLTGARLPVDLRAPLPLPLLAPLADAAAPANGGVAGEPAKPWTWRVAKLQLADAEIEMLGPGEPLPLELDVEVRDADAARASRWPLHVALAAADGTLEVDGTLAIAPLAFDGKLALAGVRLPPLLARLPVPGGELLRAGAARADLRIALAPRAATSDAAPTDLRVSGTLGLSGLDLGDVASAREFGAAWKDFEVAIRELALVDVLAPGGPRGIALGLDKVQLSEPAFTLTRSSEGIVLPTLGAREPEQQTASPAAAPPDVRVQVASARIAGARVRILDRSVTPAFRSQIDRVDIDGSGIDWPGARAEQLSVALRGLAGAKLAARGSVKPDGSKLTLTLAQLPLAQFNPYLEPTGYALASGSLGFDGEVRFAPTGYDSSTRLVVSQLALGGAQGAERFEESYGVPLSLALGLLKDLNGDIALSVPVSGERGETRIDIGSIVLEALRKALVGALASPLKLLGAVMVDGKVQTLAPEPIPFPDGSATLGPEGTARIAQLADLLAGSPGISLTLIGGTSEADARILRERAILAELRAARGVRALGALGEIGTRSAVRAHLEARLAGGPDAPLDAEQRAWLDARVAAQPLDPALLEALASERVKAARLALSSGSEIAPERIAPGSPSGAPVAQASVVLELGTPEVAAAEGADEGPTLAPPPLEPAKSR